MSAYESNDVVTSTHLTLMMGVDGSHAERFLQHLASVPGLVEQLQSVSPAVQLEWIMTYWKNQLDHVGLNGQVFLENCLNSMAGTPARFHPSSYHAITTNFICDAAQRNNLPFVNVPLHPVGQHNEQRETENH